MFSLLSSVFLSHLAIGHTFEETFLRDKLIESPDLLDAASIEHINSICITNCAESVRGDNPRHFASIQTFADDVLSPVVQSAGRFIEQQDSWISSRLLDQDETRMLEVKKKSLRNARDQDHIL